MRTAYARHRLDVLGVAGLAVVLVVLLLIVAAYQEVFSRFVTVTVHTDRAGLLLQVDSDVALHDVRIGKVSAVSTDGAGGAVITAQLDPDQARYVPADVTASVVAPTVFGPKYVSLAAPATPGGPPIADGDVVARAAVQVEANQVFDHLIGLLDGVQPAKINEALGALSTALRGRGQETGQYLADLNAYLRQFNGHLPQLRRDLDAFPDVVDTYADAAPDIVRIVGGVTTTSTTITDKKAAFDAFLLSLTQFSDTTGAFLADNRQGLADALDVLRPTTAALARYAPIFPCFFHNMNTERKVQEPSFGGVVPGLRTLTSFQPGIGPYSYPENLVKVGNVDDPSCFGGPAPGTDIPGHVTFDDGSPDLQTRDRPVSARVPDLATTLFGQAAKETGR